MKGAQVWMNRYSSSLSATFAVLLMLGQFAAIRFAPDALIVRIVLPATIAAVPVALWRYRRFAGIWVMFIGLTANLTVIVANGGLMPIGSGTVVAAIGAERASTYQPGEWIRGSKDVLVAPREGWATALGDDITIRAGGRGIVASAGDLVVWAGMLILAAEASLAWHQRRAAGGALSDETSAVRIRRLAER